MLEKIPMAASSNRLRMLLVLGDPGPGAHGELLAHVRAFLGRDKDGCPPASIAEPYLKIGAAARFQVNSQSPAAMALA